MYMSIFAYVCMRTFVSMQMWVYKSFSIYVCACVAAPSQPSAQPAGKGPGLRHQLQAGMRMAESQTDTAVGYYV